MLWRSGGGLLSPSFPSLLASFPSVRGVLRTPFHITGTTQALKDAVGPHFSTVPSVTRRYVHAPNVITHRNKKHP